MRSLSCGPCAGEHVAQEAAPQAPAHAQLVLAAQQVQRHQLLQEEQGRACQLRGARPRGRGREHALGVVHDQHVAVEHALAGVGDGQGVAGRAVGRAVGPPEARRELGRAVRAARARHHAALSVEEHDGHVEDAGDTLDELGDVLLLHHQLQQLDLQGRGAAQGLHVARRGRRLCVLAALPGVQGRLELLRVQADLVLQHDRRLEEAEVGALDVGAGLHPVHERVDHLV